MENTMKKNKIQGILARASAFGMAASAVASMTATQVFAEGAAAGAAGFNDDVNVTTSSDLDAGTMMGKIIGILLTITRFVGVALVVYGVYEVVMSFMQNQPEAKTKGIIMALAGIVCTALKSILIALGVVTA